MAKHQLCLVPDIIELKDNESPLHSKNERRSFKGVGHKTMHRLATPYVSLTPGVPHLGWLYSSLISRSLAYSMPMYTGNSVADELVDASWVLGEGWCLHCTERSKADGTGQSGSDHDRGTSISYWNSSSNNNIHSQINTIRETKITHKSRQGF